jgi:hypothetical protein
MSRDIISEEKEMKVHALLMAVAASAALCFNSVAAGTLGNDYTLEIVNHSSEQVFSLYATNVDNDDWGPDILPVSLEPGESTIIDVDDYSGYCLFDLRAETQDGSSHWTRKSYNVCEEVEWVLVD